MFARKRLNIKVIHALSCFEYVAGAAEKGRERGFEITDAKVKT